MGLINRVRRRISAFAGNVPMFAGEGDELQLNAELPGGAHGSIFKLQLSVRTDRHGDGERMHLRAHLQSNFASVLRPMLESPQNRDQAAIGAESGSRSLAPRAAIGRLAVYGARRVLRNPLLRRAADPLLHVDANSYVEVITSSASLDGGAFELMPRNEKLSQMGIRPTKQQGPHVETWSGVMGGSHAQVAALQIDKESLPERVKQQLGDTPVNLAAMIVSTVQEK